MPQAIVNPEDLRRFASQLKRFNGELQTQMSSIHGQISALGQTWRDREQEKFTEEFTQTMQAMGRFIEATNQFIPFLMRKAARAEDYLQQR